MYAYRGGEEWLTTVALDLKRGIMYGGGYDCNIRAWRTGMTIKGWLRTGFKPWMDGARAIRKHYAKGRKFAVRMAKRKMALAWESWQARYADMMAQKEIAKRTLAFWMRRTLAMAWNKWCLVHEMGKDSMGDAIKRWRNRLMYAAWNQWRDIARILRIAGDAMKAFLMRQLLAAWRKWRDVYAQTKEEIMMKVLKYWQNRKLAMGWVSYREWYHDNLHSDVPNSDAIDIMMIQMDPDNPVSPHNTIKTPKKKARVPLDDDDPNPGMLSPAAKQALEDKKHWEEGQALLKAMEKAEKKRLKAEKEAKKKKAEEDKKAAELVRAQAILKKQQERGEIYDGIADGTDYSDDVSISESRRTSKGHIEIESTSEHIAKVMSLFPQNRHSPDRPHQPPSGVGPQRHTHHKVKPHQVPELPWDQRDLGIEEHTKKNYLSKAKAKLSGVSTKLSFENLYAIWSNELSQCVATGLLNADKDPPPISLKNLLTGFTAHNLGYGGLTQCWKTDSCGAPDHMLDLKSAFSGENSNNYEWTGKKAVADLQAQLNQGVTDLRGEDHYNFVVSQVKHILGYAGYQKPSVTRLKREFEAFTGVFAKLDTASKGTATTKGLLTATATIGDLSISPRKSPRKNFKPLPSPSRLERPMEYHFHLRSPSPGQTMPNIPRAGTFE